MRRLVTALAAVATAFGLQFSVQGEAEACSPPPPHQIGPPWGSKVPLNAQVAHLSFAPPRLRTGPAFSIRQTTGREVRKHTYLGRRLDLPVDSGPRPTVVALEDLEPNSEVSVRYAIPVREPTYAWYPVTDAVDNEPPGDFNTPVVNSGGGGRFCGPSSAWANVVFEEPEDESSIAYYYAVNTAGEALSVFAATDRELTTAFVPLEGDSCFSILAVDAAGNITAAPYQCIGCSCDATEADSGTGLGAALMFFLVACCRGRFGGFGRRT